MKGKIKKVIDILMTVSLLFLMGYQFWGEKAHEWIGAGMFLLFIAHQILNWNWYKNLFRGKYTPMRVFQAMVNVLTLFSMLVQMYSGIVLSRYVFDFLSIENNLTLARQLHILGAYWGFLMMGLHLGLHWNMVIGTVKRKQNHFHRGFSLICFFTGLAVALYGLSVFIRRDFLTYMLLKSKFVFLDYKEPKLIFYLDYFALMVTCIFISHYAGKLFRYLGKIVKRKGRDLV
ncbi:MAG: DUF4405 domain-containing protein [Oscillospiraceae bacterium]|nr:DUF4405 domain-containing protein [Oscillospiraceae bacterium]